MTVFRPATSSAFVTALNSATGGDVIVLTSGADYPGPIQLPIHGGAGNIRITSTDLFDLSTPHIPPNGQRVAPSYSQYMPKITLTDFSSALYAQITNSGGASNFIIEGVEFRCHTQLS